MKGGHVFSSPYHDQFGLDTNSHEGIWDDGNEIFDGSKDFQFGFGLPGMHHIMQVYMLPPDYEQSPWKIAGMAMLLVTAMLLGLTIIFYCFKCCCCRKRTEVMADGENADETPSGEHRVRMSDDLPPLYGTKEQADLPAPFLATPTLNVSQPYQPEPEDLARMQEIMLQRLEATPEEWEIEHGDIDRKQLF